MSPLSRIAQDDWLAGSDQDSARHLIDARGAYSIRNGLLSDDGSIFRRGGSISLSNRHFGSAGRFLWDGWLEPGRRTFFASPEDFGVLDSDDATPLNLGGTGISQPLPARVIEEMLFLPGGTIYGGSRKAADYSAGTVTTTNGSKTVTGAGTAFLANVDVGMLFRISGERIYVVAAIVSDTELTLRNAYEGTTAGAKAYTLKRLETASTPYLTSNLYGVAGDRLVLVKSTEPNTIYFSEPDKPHSFLVDDLHDLDEGLSIVGLEAILDTLLVFTTAGIFSIRNMALDIVDALGTPQHPIAKHSGDVVLWGAAGVASWKGTLVCPALDGIYLVDGVTQPVPISKGVNSRYRAHVDAGRIPGQAVVYRDHYFLPVLDVAGTWHDTLVGRLDRPVRTRSQTVWPWTFPTGAGAECSAFVSRRPGEYGAKPKLLGMDSKAGTTFLDDGFTADVIGAGLYAFDEGSGTLAVSGGQLVPSDTTRKRLYRVPEGARWADVQLTLKHHTGASVPTTTRARVQKRLDASNYVMAYIDSNTNQLRLAKTDGGAFTSLAVVALAGALAANTDYWVRLIQEGNLLTAEHWTVEPTPTGAPNRTVSYTLAGADATKFGAGIKGFAGLDMTPGGTDFRYDDFKVEYPRARVLDLTQIFVPALAVKSDHDGSTPYFEIITRDYPTGNLTVNRIRRARENVEVEGDEADAPVLYVDMGLGVPEAGEVPYWDEVDWDEFDWALDESEGEWTPIGQIELGENTQNAYNQYTAERGRHARLRLRSADPWAKLTLRSLELFVAPEAGVRLAKVS